MRERNSILRRMLSASFGAAGICVAGAAGAAGGSFSTEAGPFVSFDDGGADTRTVSTPTIVQSDGSLVIRGFGDLNNDGDEDLRVFIEGVEVARFEQPQCQLFTQTVKIPEDVLAAAAGDGSVQITLQGGPSSNDFCDGSIGGVDYENVSFAAVATLSFASGGDPAVLVDNMLSRRLDRIATSGPDLTRRLLAAPTGFGLLTGEGASAGGAISFGASLSQIEDAAAAADGGDAISFGGIGRIGRRAPDRGIDVFLEGSYEWASDDGSDFTFGVLHVGVDYRPSDAFVFGAIVSIDRIVDEDDTGSEIDGVGWMVGPFIAARVAPGLIVDAEARYGRSSNTLDRGAGARSDFDGDRWLIRGGVTGDVVFGRIRFQPRLGALYAEETTDAFTDGLGFAVGEQEATLGRLTFAPRISTDVAVGLGVFTPYAVFEGIYDFESDGAVDGVTGVEVGPDELRGRVEIGFDATLENGFLIGVEGFYDGVGSDTAESYGVGAELRVPFN